MPPGGHTATAEYGRAGSFRTRLGRALAFLAIVWAIAATFVAFEMAMVASASLFYAFPDSFGTLALSRDTTESTTCVVSDRERSLANPVAVSPTAATGSWLLGVGLGRDAVVRQLASASHEILVESAGGLERLAGSLGAPAPPLFVPKQSANANREFVSFVEGDSRGTAHALALRYSPRACELFKLGAVWGYSEMVRPSVPGERAVHALEINYYAKRAGLPPPLWKPMLQATSRTATTDELIAQSEALTNGVTSHLMQQR